MSTISNYPILSIKPNYSCVLGFVPEDDQSVVTAQCSYFNQIKLKIRKALIFVKALQLILNRGLSILLSTRWMLKSLKVYFTTFSIFFTFLIYQGS